jgi:hypothetical protein
VGASHGGRLHGDNGVVVTTDTVVLTNLNVVPIAGGDTMILWRGNFAVVKAVWLSNLAVVVEPFPRPALVSGTNSLVAVSDGAGSVIAALFRFFGKHRRVDATLRVRPLYRDRLIWLSRDRSIIRDFGRLAGKPAALTIQEGQVSLPISLPIPNLSCGAGLRYSKPGIRNAGRLTREA